MVNQAMKNVLEVNTIPTPQIQVIMGLKIWFFMEMDVYTFVEPIHKTDDGHPIYLGYHLKGVYK